MDFYMDFIQTVSWTFPQTFPQTLVVKFWFTKYITLVYTHQSPFFVNYLHISTKPPVPYLTFPISIQKAQ